MPRFSQQERDAIRKRLYVEGEKLFSAHGVRKVTINDLTTATGISHGAFYTFFTSKEHLFMEINLRKQQKIFHELEVLIDEKQALNARELIKQVIYFLLDRFFTDPIIASINGEMWEYLVRRLPPQIIENNNTMDALVVEKLKDMGVEFKMHSALVVKVVQATFIGIATFANDEENEAIRDILIESIIEKVVKV